MTYISLSSYFVSLSTQENFVLLAKHNLGELHCHATALMYNHGQTGYEMYEFIFVMFYDSSK